MFHYFSLIKLFINYIKYKQTSKLFKNFLNRRIWIHGRNYKIKNGG